VKTGFSGKAKYGGARVRANERRPWEVQERAGEKRAGLKLAAAGAERAGPFAKLRVSKPRPNKLKTNDERSS
jgi:hypothetical protein